MSLNIGEAVSTGFEKLRTPAGLQLGGLYVLAVVLTGVGANSITTALLPETAQIDTPALALPIGAAAGALVMALGILLGLVLSVVILRAVNHPTADLDSIPDGLTRALPKTLLFLLIAGLIQGVLVAIGLVLLVIPGLFVLVSLYFAQVYIVIEDEGPLEGLSSSWSLSKGNRLSIFGLIVVVGVIAILGSLVGEVVGILSPVVGSLLSLAVTGFLNVFTTGALVDAYHQLADEQAEMDDLLEQPT